MHSRVGQVHFSVINRDVRGINEDIYVSDGVPGKERERLISYLES